MKRQEKADIIGELLDELYPQTPSPLEHQDPYTLLVAVLLSAQSTDKKVNEITPALFGLANTPEKMAVLDVSTIQDCIRQIGLAPTKAKNIHRMAEQLLERHEGQVPCDMEALEGLAGVGHKTASVVMSQGFGVPAFAVDTHIHRLAQRWGLTNGKNVKKTEADLKKLFDASTWNKLHLQIIFWGREFCQAKACYGLECNICASCYPKRIKPFAHKKP